MQPVRPLPGATTPPSRSASQNPTVKRLHGTDYRPGNPLSFIPDHPPAHKEILQHSHAAGALRVCRWAPAEARKGDCYRGERGECHFDEGLAPSTAFRAGSERSRMGRSPHGEIRPRTRRWPPRRQIPPLRCAPVGMTKSIATPVKVYLQTSSAPARGRPALQRPARQSFLCVGAGWLRAAAGRCCGTRWGCLRSEDRCNRSPARRRSPHSGGHR